MQKRGIIILMIVLGIIAGSAIVAYMNSPRCDEASLTCVSRQYGFSFQYPSGWVADRWNRDKHWIFYNYDPSKSENDSLQPNQNRIRITVTDINDPILLYSTQVYPESRQIESSVDTVAGQIATSSQLQYSNGAEQASYKTISLPGTDGKILFIAIYGDKSNFNFLDNLAKTVTLGLQKK
jgi:hypothetical protein